MSGAFFNLKQKLEELGYHNYLPVDAVPLVECILADLLQTTRSLQHYMDLSKKTIMQRDSILLEVEPYRCDNSKLIQENNHLHKEVLMLKEENLRVTKEFKRKVKLISDDLAKKENLVLKLQHDLRDLSLRGLCADTVSSKIKRKGSGDSHFSKPCTCVDKIWESDKGLLELKKKIQLLEEDNLKYNDEILLMKSQIENRDREILRLNTLLEGGRPLSAISKDCCPMTTENKLKEMSKKLLEMETTNDLLKKEYEINLEKQHEAMLHALSLADKNKVLNDELQKVDKLALKVEEDCNKRLAAMASEINYLQSQIKNLTSKNVELQKNVIFTGSELSPECVQKLQESFKLSIKERDALRNEINDLISLNKSLHEKILSISQISKQPMKSNIELEDKNHLKDDLRCLLENDRKKYEQHMTNIQDKLSEAINLFSEHLIKCKNEERSSNNSIYDTVFVRELHKKICESDQKILILTKENDELKSKIHAYDEGNKQNFKDVISQLNTENTDLSKENILLSQQLSQYKNLKSANYNGELENVKLELQKLKTNNDKLLYENELLRKDKTEYKLRYKEALDTTDKLKSNLAFKQKEIEQIQEENASYKMTHRSGKASADHLKEECQFLREQIKRMQSDVIKEKTLANQIKNMQIESERSSNEIQSELSSAQKKISLSKDTIDTLQKKCNNLESEILILKNDKSNLLDSLRKLDHERDKLVVELDNKAETISVLEQKLNSKCYEIDKLESNISDLKKKISSCKVTEHKLVDNETQIAFLNGEILRLTKQFDSVVIQNKHLQNSLADANGTHKVTKIENEELKKEVEGLKQQLQHYVTEIRRIEELLSQKEAERSDMLEQFASLSVEANILENTNHSLESESASKSIQLQTYINKINNLEATLLDKETIIENQTGHITAMTCKITSLENEIKLMSEEKNILEQNISYLKKMCNSMQAEAKCVEETDSELKLYENKIKSLSNMKVNLMVEKDELKEKLITTDRLLSNARQEIVELKLALQDATSETKSLQEQVNNLSSRMQLEKQEMTLSRELELPLMLEETIHEVSHEEDEDSSRYHEIKKTFSKYHSGTL
ncbi:hypothetical protein ACJJTC_003708 [Scirpophaga incertulas]